MGSSTPGSTPGSIEVTIVFVDLASFTLLTETQGDAEAVRVLGRIEELMRPLVLRHHGRVVKQIGDGFMLAFREAADAVRATIALREVLDESGIPKMRAGINTGLAVFRGGDYLGSAVNVASRVASAAMADQILLTTTTADRISGEGLALEEVGVRLLRGVDEPLALYRPVLEAVQRDPVCGTIVTTPDALRLHDRGHDLAFCSQPACVTTSAILGDTSGPEPRGVRVRTLAQAVWCRDGRRSCDRHCWASSGDP